MQLKRVEEVAYNEIKQRILDGRLAPGTRLIIRNLAHELKVSMSPVLLALRMLERDGLVVNTPGLGACVRVWTFEEAVQVFMIRAYLEALACRLCAENATRSDMDAIVAANNRIKKAFAEGEVSAYCQADMEFHRAVVQGAHCTDLVRMTDYPTMLAICLNMPRRINVDADKVHDILIDAIIRHDPVAAELEGKRHVEESVESHRGWLEETCTQMVNGPNSSEDDIANASHPMH